MILMAQYAQHEASLPPFLARENQLLGPVSIFQTVSKRMFPGTPASPGPL
jgi:hypothetical protein